MDQMLQKVIGAERISMLNGFSGYNQVRVDPEYVLKTTFTALWGTFAYVRMPFGLMNAGATFQRAMDYAFADIKDQFIVIYLDDMTVFSKRAVDHLEHLEQVFVRCRKFGISLNPNKSFFGMVEGKLLGHIVSSLGVQIYPKIVEAINTIPLPRHKKALQSFFGKINFLRAKPLSLHRRGRIFIPNFAELTKHMTAMFQKDSDLNWDDPAQESFRAIKKALGKLLFWSALIIPKNSWSSPSPPNIP